MNLNIRDFPDVLHQGLRQKSAATRREIRDLVVEAVTVSLTVKRDGVVDEEVIVTCPTCGKDAPLVRFGDNARCFHCGIGFLVPEGA